MEGRKKKIRSKGVLTITLQGLVLPVGFAGLKVLVLLESFVQLKTGGRQEGIIIAVGFFFPKSWNFKLTFSKKV